MRLWLKRGLRCPKLHCPPRQQKPPTARFANTAAGFAQLTAFAGRWSQRRWAVEGCFGAGRSLAQRLVADGERVLDVPAKLAARVRVYSRGHGRKTDKDDAVSVGLAAID